MLFNASQASFQTVVCYSYVYFSVLFCFQSFARNLNSSQQRKTEIKNSSTLYTFIIYSCKIVLIQLAVIPFLLLLH